MLMHVLAFIGLCVVNLAIITALGVAAWWIHDAVTVVREWRRNRLPRAVARRKGS